MNGIQSLFSNPTVMLAHQDENDISLIDAHTFPFSKELSLLKLVNQPQFHFLFFKMAIKIPLRFIIITPMYTSHAHLLQDRNPLTSVEGSCFPSQLVFLSLVRAFVASSSHQCHELHTPVRMPELTPRFLFVFSLAFMCILNRH